MNVVTPDFKKKLDPTDQVKELATTHIPQLVLENQLDSAVFIGANDDQMVFLTNLEPAQLNLLLDVAKQYVLLGE